MSHVYVCVRQRSLLKLRERALKEKTRAELAWLEQQKQRHRDKGADEIYPQIKKRERALVMKLQQEKVRFDGRQARSVSVSVAVSVIVYGSSGLLVEHSTCLFMSAN